MKRLAQSRQMTCSRSAGLGACALLAQTGVPPVTVKVEIVNSHAAKNPARAKEAVDLSNIVIWLTPGAPESRRRLRLSQKPFGAADCPDE